MTSPWIGARDAVTPSAVLPPVPPTLPIWAKALYYIVETVIVTYAASHYSYADQFNPVGATTADPTDGTWRHFQFVWENTASGDTGDDQVFTLDVVNLTDGHVDGSWTTEDYNAVFGQFELYLDNIAPHVCGYMRSKEIRSYIAGFRPYTDSKPFALSGAPETIWPHVVVGGATTALQMPQASCTVTERTAGAGHWGRHYLPSIGSNALTGAGTYSTAVVDAIANSAQLLYSNLMGAQFFPVVPTTQSAKIPVRTLQTVSAVQVDSTPDVVRRRRPAQTLYRKTVPVQAELELLPAPSA